MLGDAEDAVGMAQIDRWMAGCLVAFVATLAGAARAEQPLRLAFDRDGACPSTAEFMAEIRRRTEAPLVLVTDGPSDFRVVLRAGEPATGRLEAVDSTGSLAVREVRADTCSELSAALALILAMKVEQHSETSQRSERLFGDAPPAAALASEGVRPSNDAPMPRDEAMPAVEAMPTSPIAAPPTRRSWQYGLGASALLTTGIGPSLAFGGTLFYEVRRTRALPLAVRSSLVAAWGPEVREFWGTASFALYGIGLEACGGWTPRIAGIELEPCVGTHVGVAHARSEMQPSQGRSGSAAKPWLDALISIRARWRAAGWLSFEWRGGARVPAFRHEFTVGAPTTDGREFVYPTPPVAVVAEMGAVFTF